MNNEEKKAFEDYVDRISEPLHPRDLTEAEIQRLKEKGLI